MKKSKLLIVAAVCAILAGTVCASGCSIKYLPMYISVEDGYTLVWEENPWMSDRLFKYAYSVNDSDGNLVAAISPGGNSTNNEYLGYLKDNKTVGFTIYLSPDYDFDAITATESGTPMERSDEPKSFSVNGNSVVKEGFTINIEKHRKEFNVKVGGFKPMSIGGHSWKLYGVEDADGFKYLGDEYKDAVIGKTLNYKFNFAKDGGATADTTADGKAENLSGTWSEESGVLKAVFGTNTFEMSLLTQSEKNDLVALTDEDTVGAMAEWRVGETKFIFALDV